MPVPSCSRPDWGFHHILWLVDKISCNLIYEMISLKTKGLWKLSNLWAPCLSSELTLFRVFERSSFLSFRGAVLLYPLSGSPALWLAPVVPKALFPGVPDCHPELLQSCILAGLFDQCTSATLCWDDWLVSHPQWLLLLHFICQPSVNLCRFLRRPLWRADCCRPRKQDTVFLFPLSPSNLPSSLHRILLPHHPLDVTVFPFVYHALPPPCSFWGMTQNVETLIKMNPRFQNESYAPPPRMKSADSQMSFFNLACFQWTRSCVNGGSLQGGPGSLCEPMWVCEFAAVGRGDPCSL